MKNPFLTFIVLILLASCTHLTRQEQLDWRELQNLGVQDKDNQVANPALAGGLNLLPGFGNFYLASGNGGDSSHWIYGTLNLLTWPISILWAVPEAVVDSSSINKRELLYHYRFDDSGKEELKKMKEKSKK